MASRHSLSPGLCSLHHRHTGTATISPFFSSNIQRCASLSLPLSSRLAPRVDETEPSNMQRLILDHIITVLQINPGFSGFSLSLQVVARKKTGFC